MKGEREEMFPSLRPRSTEPPLLLFAAAVEIDN